MIYTGKIEIAEGAILPSKGNRMTITREQMIEWLNDILNRYYSPDHPSNHGKTRDMYLAILAELTKQSGNEIQDAARPLGASGNWVGVQHGNAPSPCNTKQSGNGKMAIEIANKIYDHMGIKDPIPAPISHIIADALNAKQDGWQPIDTAPRDGSR